MSQTYTMSSRSDNYRGNNDRSQRGRDNSDTFSGFGGFGGSSYGGITQPSTLGFVAKQEMPHHLSILFRARYF